MARKVKYTSITDLTKALYAERKRYSELIRGMSIGLYNQTRNTKTKLNKFLAEVDEFLAEWYCEMAHAYAKLIMSCSERYRTHTNRTIDMWIKREREEISCKVAEDFASQSRTYRYTVSEKVGLSVHDEPVLSESNECWSLKAHYRWESGIDSFIGKHFQDTQDVLTLQAFWPFNDAIQRVVLAACFYGKNGYLLFRLKFPILKYLIESLETFKLIGWLGGHTYTMVPSECYRNIKSF